MYNENAMVHSCGCLSVNKPIDIYDIVREHKRVGKITVIDFDHYDKKNREFYYKCKCDCGNICLGRRDHILNGDKKSCGCIQITHGMANTRFYQIWLGMKQRCKNPNSPAYSYYGGRGITYDPILKTLEMICMKIILKELKK